MNKDNETRVEDFLTFFRSLDSKERDFLFEKITTEYTEIKEMEKIGFKPLETAGITESKQLSAESAISKMKQKIAEVAKNFQKDNKKTNDMER